MIQRLKAVLRELELRLKIAVGRELRVVSDVVCPMEALGSDYGAWNIITAGLDSDTIVYSFGVGEDITFDTALIERIGLTVHAFDPTPRSIAWIKCQALPASFIMHEYGVAAFDGQVSFNPPEDPAHVSYTLLDRPATRARAISVPVKRIRTVMEELGHDHIDILKMDIEGAEYDVIDDMIASDIRPQQILVEFHHRFPGAGVKKTKQAISKIKAMGYLLFAVSPTSEDFCFVQDSDRLS